MNTIYRLYVLSGKIIFWTLLPIERLMLRRTSRVYGLITHDKQVLLAKNWLSDGKWALPGGGTKRSESMKESLLRELEEELNIRLNDKQLKHVSSGHWKNHNFGFKYEVYEVKGKVSFSINRKLEITDAAWVNISSLNRDNIAVDILEVLAKSN